ncbi:MAG: dehydrogenase [Prevotella sp.]|nr:dehydrogenase [Prevotella sp.]
MADNFLERHYEEYEARKEAWLKRKKHFPKKVSRTLEKPDDEAL